MANLDAIYDIDNRIRAFENHNEGLLVSIAGPGTGKSYSFLKQIKSLTDDQQATLDQICYLTFIKEITKAFITDYEEEFGAASHDTQKPRISTLHSFACRILRNRGFSIGFDGPLYFTSISDKALKPSEVFLNDLLPLVNEPTLQTVSRLRKLLEEKVKEAWRNNVDPATLGEPVPSVLEVCLSLSRVYRLIDWDQAIPLAHHLFQNPQNRQSWITNIEHYLVDEYQDFNKAEQAFISSLRSIATSIVIVGDDNQSIYSRRGGSPSGIRELFQLSDCDRVTLLRCRRCRADILRAANTFLASIRRGATPMVPFYDGGEIECYKFRSTRAELAFLVGFLQARLAELPENPSPKDGIVCLFPSWKALEFYFNCLKSEIPCYTRKTQASAKREWLFMALLLICNPHQRFIERLILETLPEIKPRHKKAMVELILDNDISPVDAMEMLLNRGSLSAAAADSARDFLELCSVLSSQDSVISAGTISSRLRCNIEELGGRLGEFISQIGDVDQEDAINDLCDQILPDSALPPDDPRSIQFLTMHGSKGLTKRVVVMPGLEDAWLPGDASGSELNERARLFYVALTRATDYVIITYPRTRARRDPLNYDTSGRGQVCRFVISSGLHDVYYD